ncbi:MAG: SH3 domain-containing protein [Bacteroidetes bacterium]|nr:SH3 domain-containing protein [Bacteroidota bacterium]
MISGRGQCLISCVPVRAEDRSASELVTQILYGETYSVLERSEKWLRIKLETDGYEGWISSDQFSKIVFEPKGIQREFPFVWLDGIMAPVGSLVPGDLVVEFPDWLNLSRQMLNVPYLWGGKTFMGIDCSGFVQVVFKVSSNLSLPRDSSQQALVGDRINFENRLAGDLAFFKNNNGVITHVGILTSEKSIIHSSGKVREDGFDERGIIRPDGSISHSFSHLQRVFNGLLLNH